MLKLGYFILRLIIGSLKRKLFKNNYRGSYYPLLPNWIFLAEQRTWYKNVS